VSALTSAAHPVPKFFNVLEKLSTFKRLITAPEVAEITDLHRLTVYRLAKDGRIPCYRISGLLRFDPAAVAEYLRAHELQQ